MDTPKPAEYRLSPDDADYLAATLHACAVAGRLTCVYCRHRESGELYPILAALIPNSTADGDDRLLAIGQIFAPGIPKMFDPPTEADNPMPAPDDVDPKIILPSEYGQ